MIASWIGQNSLNGNGIIGPGVNGRESVFITVGLVGRFESCAACMYGITLMVVCQVTVRGCFAENSRNSFFRNRKRILSSYSDVLGGFRIIYQNRQFPVLAKMELQ